MFSIIIPVYNVEKHLDKCLRSVVNQTFKDIEIIVVDDGSTDGSIGIIERYRLADRRIKIITQKNSGPGGARNNGIDAATREYVMFIDADDFIEENTCERLAEYIEKDKCDVYIYGLYYDYEKEECFGGQNLQYKKYDNGKMYMEVALIEGNFRTFAHSKLFKICLLGANTSAHSDKIRFVPGFFCEDMYFNVQVFCKANSVTIIPEFLYHYVQHQDGRATTKYREKDLDALKYIGLLNNNYYKTGNINKFIYAVLVFRCISSSVIYKYIHRYFFNRQARYVIDTVIENENFAEAVMLCATEDGIPKRDRYLAKLLYKNQLIYKIVVCFLVMTKKMLHRIK